MLPDLREPSPYVLDWPHELLVVVPMRNCVQYVGHCMTSLLGQSAPFRAVVLDDLSTDGTFEQAQVLVGRDERFTLVHNKERRGALANIAAGVDLLDPAPGDVVATVDGDDWLPDRGALAHVISTYAARPRLRMTYGQFVHASSGAAGMCAPYPAHVVSGRRYRHHAWLASHLRTFRAELWRKILQADLIDPKTGRHWEMAWDLAMMFPMLEMCESDQIAFVSQAVYIYNDCNALNDNKVNAKLQRDIEALVRGMPIYPVTPP